MFTVVGVRECSGVYEGRGWSHTKLYVLSEDKYVKGFKAEFLKVPSDVALPDFSNLPCMIDCGFDRYGNVATVNLIDSDVK